MKKSNIVLFIALIFSSCEKIEDDSNLICTENCTSISGKVYTHSDIPLKNVRMKFKFQKSDSENPNLRLTRIISREKSNALGIYTMDFFLLDEELGSQFGYFSLYPERESIPRKVFYPDYFDLFQTIYDIPSRNISFQKDLYLPTLKKIKIKLNGFEGIQQDDYFRVMSLIPCGFDKEVVDPNTGNNHNYVLYGLNKYSLSKYNNDPESKVFEVYFALNELNYIQLGKMKNGIYTQENIPINVTADINQIFEFNY